MFSAQIFHKYTMVHYESSLLSLILQVLLIRVPATNITKTPVKSNLNLPRTNVFMNDQREREEKNKKFLEQISITNVTLSQKACDADVMPFIFKFYRIL